MGSLRRVLPALLALAGLVGTIHAEEEPGGRGRWLLLGPDGRPLPVVVRSDVPSSRGGGPVFDPDEGGETRKLVRGVLEEERPTSGVVVWGPGLEARLLEGGERVVGLRLARAVSLGGRLRFDRGGGAADALLFARRAGTGGLVHRTRTDEKGAWRFAHTGAGAWEVSVRRGDGRLQSLGRFNAGEGEAETVLTPGSRVDGQILDGDASERTGVGGVQFVLVGLPGATALSEEPFETDDEGCFVLDDVPEGIYEARLVEGPYFFHPAAPRLEVPARGIVSLRGWYVLRSRTLAGRVEGPRSAKVEGASVRLVPDATRSRPSGGWPPVPPASTDAEGRFEIRGVRPATGYRLAVKALGYAATLTAPFDVSGPKPTEVPTVLLASGWRLEVRARAPGGAPVAGVRILVVPADRPVAPDGPEWPALAREGVTDADGRAVLSDLPEGDVRAVATSPRVTDVATLVPYPPAGDVRTWTATVFPAPGLQGKVEGWGGDPLGALEVRAVTHGEGSVRIAEVGADGRFAFQGLSSEPVDLLVVRARARDGLVLGRAEGLVPGTVPHVTIHLPQPGVLEGRVEDLARAGPAGKVLLEAPVLSTTDDAFRWRTVSGVTLEAGDRSALFRFSGLAPGTYALRAVQGDNDSGQTTVRLDGGATEHVELLLGEVGRVAGTVLDGEDRPVLGAQVRLVRLRGDGDAPGRPDGTPRRATDGDGGYVFEDLAPGVWRVEVRDGDLSPDQEVVRVEEGESVVVRDLFVGRGGTLAGTVSDGEGRILDGALLVLTAVEEGLDERRAQTGRDGAFSVEGLKPGFWRLRLAARAGPFSGLEVLAEVVAFETTELELTAGGRGRILGRVERLGRPVPDLGIYLISRPGGEAGLARRRFARTDAEGRFAFDGLRSGAYEVDLADGGVWSTRPVVIEDGDVLQLDLEAFEGRIPGHVVLPSGSAVADATVIARPQAGGGILGRVRTDPEGRFLIVGLPTGPYDLEVSAPGLPPGRLAGAVAEVYGAERPVSVTLGRGGTLDLTVEGPNGRGVAGTRVWLEDAAGQSLHLRPYVTGYRGLLRLEGVTPGPVWIRTYARHHGRPPRRAVRVVEAEVSPVEIRMPPPARLTVRITGAHLDPPPRARIELLRMPARELVVHPRTLSRARLEPVGGLVPRSGLVVFDELGPGAYLIRVEAGSAFEVVEMPFEIGALDDAFVEVDLTRVR